MNAEGEGKSYPEVLALLRAGFRARRYDWPPGQCVFLVAGGRVADGITVREAPTDDESSPCAFVHGLPPLTRVLSTLCLKQGMDIQLGWSPTTEDQLALDWSARVLWSAAGSSRGT